MFGYSPRRFARAPVRCFARAAVKFGRSCQGVAAVEFAMLAPLLVLMVFGTFEVSRAVLAHKRFQHAVAMVGDLVAREQHLGTDQASADDALAGIVKSAEHAMLPFSAAPLKIGIYSIRAHSTIANSNRVEWSYSYNGKAVQAKCASKNPPASGMMTPGNAVVMVEANYTYTPVLAGLIPGFTAPLPYSDVMTYSPRNSCVDYAGQNCVLACPGW